MGMQAAIHKDDSIITAYRCHAWTYIRGIPVAEILSELAGKRQLILLRLNALCFSVQR